MAHSFLKHFLNDRIKSLCCFVFLFSKCGRWCNCEAVMAAFKGIWTKSFWKSVSAEFLAMLIFVFLSLGSTINWGGIEKPLPVDMVLISLCFGLSIATMVQCIGHISGGHINPAVTVAMVCTRKISLAKSVFYIVAQCLGAIAGAGILYLVTPSSVIGGLGVTQVGWKNGELSFLIRKIPSLANRFQHLLNGKNPFLLKMAEESSPTWERVTETIDLHS